MGDGSLEEDLVGHRPQDRSIGASGERIPAFARARQGPLRTIRRLWGGGFGNKAFGGMSGGFGPAGGLALLWRHVSTLGLSTRGSQSRRSEQEGSGKEGSGKGRRREREAKRSRRRSALERRRASSACAQCHSVWRQVRLVTRAESVTRAASSQPARPSSTRLPPIGPQPKQNDALQAAARSKKVFGRHVRTQGCVRPRPRWTGLTAGASRIPFSSKSQRATKPILHPKRKRRAKARRF